MLRRRFLTIAMAATLLWSGFITAATLLGDLPMGESQTWNNAAFFVLNAVLLLVVRFWPRHFEAVAAIYFVTGFAVIVAALFLVPGDELRLLLFFPAVGIGFLMLGSTAGWTLVLVSLAAFGASVATRHVEVSTLAISTFVITLTLTGTFFHVFRVQAIRALETVAEQNAALDAAARQDHLTGLLNLRAFREAMDVQAIEARGALYALAFIDVDHFKAINDRWGHAGGDTVLSALANTLKAAVRSEDLVARIGGEEFAILLPHTDLPSALKIAERLRTAVEAMRVEIGGTGVSVTISIGVAGGETGQMSTDILLRAADAAMYAAKSEGRNRVVASAQG